MNFLSPTSFWLLGLIVIPIVIHFFNKFQIKKVKFSSIRFIKKLESSSIKRIRIEKILLLLIRILIIIFLVMIFSNPVTKGFSPRWLLTEQDSITLFIIDNSASMNAFQKENSNLDNAKFEALNILSLFNVESKILIYQTCPPKQIFNGTINDPSLITSIESIKSTSSFDNIWKNINKFLDDKSITEPIKECLVFSDFMHYPDSLFNNEKYTNKNWKFYFICSKPIVDNLSINSVFSLNPIKTINQLIKLDAKIINTGEMIKNNIPLELLFNKQRVGQIISDFIPNKNKGFLFQAYPTNNGIVHGQFLIPEDDYEYDNIWHEVIPIIKQIRCAIIGSSQKDIELLELLLRSIDSENNFLDVESRIQPNLNRLFLDQFDVAIIHNSQKITSDGVKDLEKFIESGGGIIWFQGNKNYREYHSDLYEKLNFPKNMNIVNSGEGYFSIASSNQYSGLLENILLKDFHSQLPKITNYSNVITNSNHKIHWRLNNDDPFLLEFKKGTGTVFYFSTLLDLDWNDLLIRGIVIPLIYQMLVLTGNDEVNTLPVIIDEPKWISIKEEELRKKWEVKSNNGTNILIVPDFDREGITIYNTNELGLYSVYSNDVLFTSFPTRLHKLEYIKPLVDLDKFKNFIPEENLRWIMIKDNFKQELSEIRNGKSLWRFFLFIVIILILLETIIGRPNLLRMKVENK